MTFDEDYNDLLLFAKKIIAKRSIEFMQAEDVVSEAFVNLFSNVDYDYHYDKGRFKAEISKILNTESYKPKKLAFNEVLAANDQFTEQNTCRGCKQVKCASEFVIETNKFGKKYLSTVCKDCERKYALKRYHEIKNSEEYKNYNKNNFKKYVDKNRGKWNAYLRERYKLKKLGKLKKAS